MNLDKVKMLCTRGYEPGWFPKFEGIFDIERKGFSLGDSSSMIVLKGEKLVECLAGKEIRIIGYNAVTEDVTRKSVDARLLLSVRGGPKENIGINTYIAAGISVIPSAGRCAVPVVEFTFLLMPMLARPIVPVIEKIGSEGWTKRDSPGLRSIYVHRSTELYNKNFRIIGFGRNAKSLSVLVNAFRMQVNTHDSHVSEEVVDSFHVKRMGSGQVVRTTDYVIALAWLAPDTGSILNRELISFMKSTASIVNTERTRLVDGEAILDMLEQQVIKPAALNIHAPEPLGAFSGSRIYQIPKDRSIITFRAAGVTKERSWHQHHLFYKQLLEYFQGNAPEGCIDKQVFDTPQFKERGGEYFGIR